MGKPYLWPPCIVGWSRMRTYIFSSCFFFLLLFFLAKSQRSQIGCLPYFYTWCGPSANLECTSEMWCTRLAGNAERKKSPSAHHRTTLPGYIGLSSQLRHILTIGKKLIKQQYLVISPTRHNRVNIGPLTAEIDWRVWAPQQISTGFASWLRYCSDVAQWRSTKLCTMFGRLLEWYTIYTFSGSLAP